MTGIEPWLRLPDYASYTLETWLVFALCGTAGFLLRVSVACKPLRGPELTPTGMKLNSLGDWLMSAIVASLADHNVLFATIAGAGAPTIIEFIMQWLPRALRRAVGLPEPTGKESGI